MSQAVLLPLDLTNLTCQCSGSALSLGRTYRDCPCTMHAALELGSKAVSAVVV